MKRNKKGQFVKGHKVSTDVRKKIGQANEGRVSHRKGKTIEEEYSKERAEKIRKKLSESHMGNKAWNKDRHVSQLSGENHWNWKGGITDMRTNIRESLEYKKWRKEIFERDDYTCQECGERGGYLEVHHIKPLNGIIKDNNIHSFEETQECDELWKLENGKTLCRSCHKETESFPKNLRHATVRTHEK